MSVGVSEPQTAQAPPRAASSAAPVTIVPVLDRATWDVLLARAAFPHLPQAYGYGEGKRATGWSVERVALQRGGRSLAIATALVRRLFGIRILVRINRGPILLEPLSAQDVTALYAALRRHWRGPLLIAPALPHGADSTQILAKAGFRLRHDKGWMSGRIDLDREPEQIWSGLASTFRNRVRQAEKASPSVRIAIDDATYEWLLDRHVENMRDKGFSAAEPVLLRALRAARPQDVLVFQMIHDGQAVAGMSVVLFGDCAEYHVGWFGPEGRRFNAGNFLMWEVIKDLQRRGVRQFDVGGLKPGDGYTQFKRTMRPVEFRLAGEWMSFW
ncbi:GNAT family N-acetyltransferase [Devosia sp.]|uniref:lipid II:glycine glycyltransferase FemX n=1 Tax=Devosia sp. TaxID=1871048 RepID=UPI00292EF054|nr:GNAT family N-acetyltransferase [Devosia sp.]